MYLLNCLVNTSNTKVVSEVGYYLPKIKTTAFKSKKFSWHISINTTAQETITLSYIIKPLSTPATSLYRILFNIVRTSSCWDVRESRPPSEREKRLISPNRGLKLRETEAGTPSLKASEFTQHRKLRSRQLLGNRESSYEFTARYDHTARSKRETYHRPHTPNKCRVALSI